MPKIIKNVEQKILDSANELFQSNGYDEVDMKEISKNAGIAVGTLYNYYPNKKQLFLRVLDLNWEKTFTSLDEIMNMTLSPKDKLRKLLEKLYFDMSEREVIIQEFFEANPSEAKRRVPNGKKNCRRDKIRENIISKVEGLIIQIKEKHSYQIAKDVEKRVAGTLVMSVFAMVVEYPEENEKNLNYINYIIDLVCR